MPQIFSPHADRRLRLSLWFAVVSLAALGLSAWALARSDGAWNIGVAATQPIPFSHAVHAGNLDLDCRYCHATVERRAEAGMPTAETCLGCHRQVWNVAAQFAPLESALELATPVPWISVHRLPGHVRFHHAAHVASGVACAQCHGDVRAMPRTVKVETLSMGWCLDCHRQAGAAQSTTTADLPPAPQHVHYGIELSPLTRCSTCHR